MEDNQPQLVSTTIPTEEQDLLAGVEPRILRITLVLGVLGAAAFWVWQGAAWGAGFAIGAALSALSFHWMKGAVHKIADAVLSPDGGKDGGRDERTRPRGAAGAMGRFILRYGLIGLVGYVIFRSSVISLAAFFAGLFVSIVAVLAEIGYQIYLSFRRA
jgi:hypothetical protein